MEDEEAFIEDQQDLQLGDSIKSLEHPISILETTNKKQSQGFLDKDIFSEERKRRSPQHRKKTNDLKDENQGRLMTQNHRNHRNSLHDPRNNMQKGSLNRANSEDGRRNQDNEEEFKVEIISPLKYNDKRSYSANSSGGVG